MAYELSPALGMPGQIAYPGGFNITRAAEVALPFGRFATRGTAEGQAKLPTTTTEVTATGLGFVVRNHLVLNEANAYPVTSAVTIAKDGFMWVTSETTVTAGAPVFVRFTTATDGSDLGACRADADTAKAVAVPGAYFHEARTGAGLVRISFKVPG